MFTLQIARVLVRNVDRDHKTHRRKAKAHDVVHRSTEVSHASMDRGQHVQFITLR